MPGVWWRDEESSFIEKCQPAVVEKILRHCGLWKEAASRPPPVLGRVADGEPDYDYGYFDRVRLVLGFLHSLIIFFKYGQVRIIFFFCFEKGFFIIDQRQIVLAVAFVRFTKAVEAVSLIRE